jgi:hypothetical protein
MSLGLHTVLLFLLQIYLYLQQVSVYNSDVCKPLKAVNICFTSSLLLIVICLQLWKKEKHIF